MSLEQSIQNLADAINNLAKLQHNVAMSAAAESIRQEVALEKAMREQQFATAYASEGMPPTRNKDEILNTKIVGSNKTVAEVITDEPKAEKAKLAASEKTAEKAPEPAKTEEPKAVEGEVITADEKTEEEIRQEAFGAPDGYIYKPFIALGQGGKNVAAQKAICAQFGVQRISLVPLDQIPALKAAVEAALAEVQG